MALPVSFLVGSSQYSLQRNRIAALKIASTLLQGEMAGQESIDKEALQKAVAPLASLISKSEKAQQKLAPGSWQHTMLEKNLKALAFAMTLLTEALDSR